MKRKIIILLLVSLFSILFLPAVASAKTSESEPWKDYNLEASQKELEKSTKGQVNFDIKKYVVDVFQGKKEFSGKEILSDIQSELVKQLEQQKQALVKLLIFGVLAGVFANFGSSMGRKELGETGFFVVYMLLFTTLSGAFIQAFQIAEKMMQGLLDFVKVFFPSFCLSLSASQGSATGYGVYQVSMFAMYLAENVLVKVVLPGIQVYFFLALANQLLKEQRFSKLVELIRSFLRWVMKTLFGVVLGLQGVQMLILPVSEQVKKNVLLKGLSGVPGVGGALGTVAETVVGTGTVIKSAIGVGGVIAICLICMIPLIQVGTYAVVNLAGAAIIQPITDKRIVASVSVAAESGKLLTRFVSMGALMFLCCLAMVIGMTNVR